jgi:hypothetical protein
MCKNIQTNLVIIKSLISLVDGVSTFTEVMDDLGSVKVSGSEAKKIL